MSQRKMNLATMLNHFRHFNSEVIDQLNKKQRKAKPHYVNMVFLNILNDKYAMADEYYDFCTDEHLFDDFDHAESNIDDIIALLDEYVEENKDNSVVQIGCIINDKDHDNVEIPYIFLNIDDFSYIKTTDWKGNEWVSKISV